MHKMKSNLALFIVILSALLLLFLNRNSANNYESHVVSEKEYENIMSSRSKSDSSLVYKLVFNEETLFYDDINSTFLYSIVEEDPNGYNPFVKAYANEGNINIAVKEKFITEELIKQSEHIEFIAYTEDFYSEYVLKCTTLPLMSIECKDEITEEDVTMKMRLFDNRKDAVQRDTYSDGKMHIRGGSTKSFPKLGYKMSLTTNSLGGNLRESKRSLLGMRQDDDWILYAAYNDQEKIRNVFSSNLWMDTCGSGNNLNIENGMRYEYIELFLNGEYWGLYALGYPIDDLQLKIDSNNQECIYKKVQWASEYPIEFTEEGEINGYKIASNDKSDWSLLQDYYEKLSNGQMDTEWYRSSIDIENAANYALFINLIQGVDNIRCNLTKNMYISTVEYEENQYKYLYTPWDMDITWGNNWNADAKNLTVPYEMGVAYHVPMESGAFYKLLVNHDKDAWNTLLNKYHELRSNLWSEEVIIDCLNDYEKQIFDSGAYLRDMDRWPDGSYVDSEVKLSEFKDYVLERLEELDLYYNRLEKVSNEHIYVMRAAQYKNFKESCFVIQLDEEYYMDEDFAVLLKHIGININDIPQDIKYIFYNGKNGMTEYKNELSEVGTAIKTCIGDVELIVKEEEEANNQRAVCVNGEEWFLSTPIGEDDRKVVFKSEKDSVVNSFWLGK